MVAWNSLKAVEMERIGQFKRYLRGKLTGIGDGWDEGVGEALGGMRRRGIPRMAPEFLALIAIWIVKPFTETENTRRELVLKEGHKLYWP